MVEPKDAVNRDVFELAQQLNSRFGEFEKNFNNRVDRLENMIGTDAVQVKKDLTERQHDHDEKIGNICDEIFGNKDQRGMKERLEKIESTLSWQWIAIGAAYGFVTFVLSLIVSHIGGF